MVLIRLISLYMKSPIIKGKFDYMNVDFGMPLTLLYLKTSSSSIISFKIVFCQEESWYEGDNQEVTNRNATGKLETCAEPFTVKMVSDEWCFLFLSLWLVNCNFSKALIGWNREFIANLGVEYEGSIVFCNKANRSVTVR